MYFKKNLWVLVIFVLIPFEVLKSSEGQDLVVVQPNSPGRTPKVSFALTEQGIKDSFAGVVEKHKQQRAAKKIRKQLMQVVTPDAMQAFENISQPELLEQLSTIIPLPQALQASSEELYRQLIATDSDGMARILNDTVMMAGEVSIDIFEQFFNVVCLNEQVLSDYTKWLHARLIPAVVQVLNDRAVMIRNNIVQEQSRHVLSFQPIKDKFQDLVLQQEVIERRAVQTESAAMIIVPVVAYAQSRLIQSPAVRLISYAAFAALTIKFLSVCGGIFQKTQREKQRLISLEQTIEKSVQNVQDLKIPEIRVVDEVVGRLIRDFFKSIQNYTNFEQDRLRQQLLAEREHQQMMEELIAAELNAERISAERKRKQMMEGFTTAELNDAQNLESTGQTQNRVVQSLCSVARAMEGVKKFAASWNFFKK